MVPFVPELWAQIVQYMDRKTLLAFYTTSRTFSAIAQPCIYDQVSLFGIPFDVEIDPSEEPPYYSGRFFRLLAERPDLVTLVHSLELQSVTVLRNYLQHARTHNVPMFLQLPSFLHLRQLEITDYYIDATCYAAILSIPRLERLEMRGCMMVPNFSQPLPQENLRSTILELSVKMDGGFSWNWAPFTQAGLKSLLIGHDIERDSPLYAARTISDMILRGVNKTLTRLEWTFPYAPDGLIDLLNFSAEIRHLSLKSADETLSEDVKALSAGAIPKLAHFVGPASCTGSFIQGRPVHSVGMILTANMPPDSFDSLRSSSLSVTDLELYWDVAPCMGYLSEEITPSVQSLVSVLHKIPSTLRRVGLDRLPNKGDEELWLHAISHIDNLRFLTFFCEISESLHRDFVESSSEICPSLKEILYAPYRHAWIKQDDEVWIKRDDGNWERCRRCISYSS